MQLDTYGTYRLDLRQVHKLPTIDLPRKHIRVMRPGEGLLELFQLKAGKGRSVTALFSLGREVVGLRFALGAHRRRSRMSALFLGPHLLRGDTHLDGLGRRRRR